MPVGLACRNRNRNSGGRRKLAKQARKTRGRPGRLGEKARRARAVPVCVGLVEHTTNTHRPCMRCGQARRQELRERGSEVAAGKTATVQLATRRGAARRGARAGGGLTRSALRGTARAATSRSARRSRDDLRQRETAKQATDALGC